MSCAKFFYKNYRLCAKCFRANDRFRAKFCAENLMKKRGDRVVVPLIIRSFGRETALG